MRKKLIKITGTGHRPRDCYGDYDPMNPIRLYVLDRIRKFFNEKLSTNKLLINSGCALGFDQDLIEVCIELSVPFIAWVPHVSQESIWPKASQIKYHSLLKKAKEVIVCSSGSYSPAKMLKRNIMMAENCDEAIALWTGKQYGGTYHCIQHLQKLGKPITRINPNDYKSGKHST